MYQIIILGAGPAGLSAGLYCQRYGLKFLLIGQVLGGTVNEARKVENYLGFEPITGPALAEKFSQPLKNEIRPEQVENICQPRTGVFEIKTNQNKYQSQALIIALGMKSRKLGLKNEEKFLNNGLTYYLPDDIRPFKNKTAAIIGGGDSALDAALKLADQAQKIYLIHRRDEFRAAEALVEKVKKEPKIEIIYSAQALEAQGEKTLQKIILDNGRELKIDHLIIQIGGVPNLHLCNGLNLAMAGNFIQVDKNQATNIAGVFAAGDITDNPLKQIITAASEGAIAAFSAFKYLKEIKS